VSKKEGTVCNATGAPLTPVDSVDMYSTIWDVPVHEVECERLTYYERETESCAEDGARMCTAEGKPVVNALELYTSGRLQCNDASDFEDYVDGMMTKDDLCSNEGSVRKLTEEHSPRKDDGACKRWIASDFPSVSFVPPSTCEKFGGWDVTVTKEFGLLCSKNNEFIIPVRSREEFATVWNERGEAHWCKESVYFSREKESCVERAEPMCEGGVPREDTYDRYVTGRLTCYDLGKYEDYIYGYIAEEKLCEDHDTSNR